MLPGFCGSEYEAIHCHDTEVAVGRPGVEFEVEAATGGDVNGRVSPIVFLRLILHDFLNVSIYSTLISIDSTLILTPMQCSAVIVAVVSIESPADLAIYIDHIQCIKPYGAYVFQYLLFTYIPLR